MRKEKLSNFIEWGVLVFPFLGLFLFWGYQEKFNKSPKEIFKEAVEKKLSISLDTFYLRNVEYYYAQDQIQIVIQKELKNENYHVITISPTIYGGSCHDYVNACFNLILDKNHKVIFASSDLGEVYDIKEKSVVFYSCWDDYYVHGAIFKALKLSNWEIYESEWTTSRLNGKEEISETTYYLNGKEIIPTSEIIELF